MKKTRKWVALLLSMVLLLTACGGNTNEETKKPDGEKTQTQTQNPTTKDAKTVLNIALSENITKLDPHDIFNFPVFTACWMMYDSLINTDHEGNYSAALATEWSKSEDGLTWTFKLREGVKFQNGEDFDSADVVATFQRFLDNRNLTCALTYWPYLESVTAVDQYTVDIKLTQAFGAAEYAFSNTWIIPNEAWEEKGEALWTEQAAVGTGPWQLVEWVDGQYTHFKKFEGSWDTYDTEVEEVYLRHILEPSTAINGQLSGEIDAYLATGGVARDMLPMYKGTEETTEMVNQDVGIFHYMQFQCKEGSIFADERVREAFSLAIDRELLVEAVLGAGSVPTSIMPDGSLGYDETLPAYEYDPEKAVALLEEAGYNGEEFTIYTHTGIPMGKQLLIAIQDMLAQVGFNAKIEPVEVSALNTIRQEGSYDVFLASNNHVGGDPYAHINQRILSDNHHSNYVDDELMSLIEQSNVETDATKREELLQQVGVRMRETFAPQIVTDQMQACYPINYGVTGIQLYKDGFINLRYVDYDASLLK